MKLRTFAVILAVPALLLPSPAHAQTVAYDAIAQAGNQTFTGNLGLDFDVNVAITITSLGVFDSNGDGISGTITVAIFNRDTTLQVGPAVSFTGSGDVLVNGSRFRALGAASFGLPPGHYSVVAVGFGPSDLNGNSTLAGPFAASTENTGSGLISFVGAGRFDTNTSLDFPTIVPAGAPSNVFLAGTFQFIDPPHFLGGTTLDPPYQVRYATNLTSGIGSIVNIVNTGGSGGVPVYGQGFGANNAGNICVNVYALDPSEELVSCCSCLLTPNQVKEMDVGAAVNGSTLTGLQQDSMVIKLVGSSGDAAAPFVNQVGASTCSNEAAQVTATAGTHSLVGGFAAFGTTSHTIGGANAVTETPFLPATLSLSELTSLTTRCSAIVGNASGGGICTGCTLGALGATKK
jgi:hypothetical protein